MRADLMPHNIGVSVLCPGMVDTNILDSERNRPKDLDHGARPWEESLPAEERAAFVESIRASMIDPAIVGDMVLHAIQTDEFYIFTHPGIEPMTQLRGTEIGDAFARWRDYCDARNI